MSAKQQRYEAARALKEAEWRQAQLDKVARCDARTEAKREKRLTPE
jgi:hypothetical protein